MDAILEKLPFQPDRIHRKGEKRGKSILEYREDWFAFSAATEGVRFDEAVSALLGKLHPVRQKLRQACGSCQTHLSCVFYFQADHRPYVHFSPETLGQLHDLKAAIDVDLYPMSSGEE